MTLPARSESFGNNKTVDAACSEPVWPSGKALGW